MQGRHPAIGPSGLCGATPIHAALAMAAIFFASADHPHGKCLVAQYRWSSTSCSALAPSTLRNQTFAMWVVCWKQKKIAAMAEAASIGVAPHNPLGPIAGVAALHFAISNP